MLVTLLFGSLAAAFSSWAYALGGLGWVLLYPAVSCAAVSLAYLLNRPGFLGKRADGSMPTAAVAFYLAPLLVLWGRWHAIRRWSSERAWVRVGPGLWLGRRPLAGELPPEVDLVVDLTSEWHRPGGLEALAHRWLPALDGMCFPDSEALRTLVHELAGDPRPMYVHCAAGHGRSGLVMAALLVRRGLASTPEDALTALKKLRPRVHLTRGQRRQLQQLVQGYSP